MPPSDHHHPPPPPKPNPKFLSLILKAIIMTVITVLFFIFLGVAAILLLLATAAVHRHSTPSNSSNFSRKDLRRLPQFKFWRKTKPEAEPECAVCLDGIKQGQWCRKLVGCGHLFHRRCVDTWLVKVASCPICRSRVRLESGSMLEDRLLQLQGSGWRNELRVW